MLIQEKLYGWGRNRNAWSMSCHPQSFDEITEILKGDKPNYLAYGKGRSYGDTALCSGGIAIHFDRLDRAISFDNGSGELICEAGITLQTILNVFVPRGWFLPVTPGTSYPTLGGCIGTDVHGKNHHKVGTISDHVNWIELLLANGSVKKCSRKENPELFFATIGGLGLTGLILKLSINLTKIPSAYISEESIAVENLKEMMEYLTVSDSDYPYTVAWMDCDAKGKELGRGQVLLGKHSELEELTASQRKNPFLLRDKPVMEVPFTLPISAVNNLTVKMFNNLKYAVSSHSLKKHIVAYNSFFYPLDAAKKWNRLYGSRGFIQYQFVVDEECAEDVVTDVLNTCHRENQTPSLVVLKRFGKSNDSYLSFPRPGWTLAMDLPVKNGLDRLLDRLDEIILANGGRNYLAKDSNLNPDKFREMYSGFEEWYKVKMEVDPEWRFVSNMSRRLKMEDGI